MGSIPVPSTKTKGCPEVARLMTSFFVFHVFCFSMHERLITDIGYPGIYSLSVKRRGFTDKHIKTTTCPQKGGVSRTSSFLNYMGKSKKKPNHHK